MKKLLTLLGAIGLVASTGLTVIACGSKVPDEETPPDEGEHLTPNEVIEKMKGEFDNIVSKVMSKSITNFTTSVSNDGPENGQYKFYNLEKLISNPSFQFDKDSSGARQKVFEFTSSDENSELLKEDLRQLMPDETFLKELNSVFVDGANKDLYKNYFNGSDATLGSYGISFNNNNKFTVTRTVDADNNELFSIDFVFDRIMKYKDVDGNSAEFKTAPISTTIVIGAEGGIASTLKELASTLPTELFKKGAIQLKSSMIYNSLDDGAAKDGFKTYGLLNGPISTYLNSKSFTEPLTDAINTIFAKKASVKMDGEIVDPKGVNTTKTFFGWEGSNIWTQSKYLVDGDQNALLNSLLFKSNSSIEKEGYMSKEDAIRELKVVIAGYDESFDGFNRDLESFIKSEVTDVQPNDIEKLKAETYTYGNFQLSGLKFNITNAGEGIREIPIATMSIPWTYSDDGLGEPEQGDIIKTEIVDKGDAFLGALYESLIEVNKEIMQINSNKEAIFKKMFTTTYDDNGSKLLDSLKVSLSIDEPGLDKDDKWQNFRDRIEKGWSPYLTGKWLNLAPATAFDQNIKFHFSGFNMGINISEKNVYNIAAKKVQDKDGNIRYGIGLRTKLSTNNTIVTLKMNLGQTRIQTHLLDGYSSTPCANYSGEGGPGSSSFYGGVEGVGYTFQQFVEKINSNWEDFLMFEFDKKSWESEID